MHSNTATQGRLRKRRVPELRRRHQKCSTAAFPRLKPVTCDHLVRNIILSTSSHKTLATMSLSRHHDGHPTIKKNIVMNSLLSACTARLYSESVTHDSAQPDRLLKRRNLEPATARKRWPRRFEQEMRLDLREACSRRSNAPARAGRTDALPGAWGCGQASSCARQARLGERLTLEGHPPNAFQTLRSGQITSFVRLLHTTFGQLTQVPGGETAAGFLV